MSRRLNPNIIRADDRVVVITPDFFVRCGYPKTIEDCKKEIREVYTEDINELMKKVGLHGSCDSVFSNCDSYTIDKIVSALAYAKLKKDKFGGCSREIYTQRIEEHTGKEYLVSKIKHVQTGTYEAGYWSGMGYEPEYEPAYLSDQKTYKILTLGIHFGLSDGLRIEAKNVEKVLYSREEGN